MLRKLIVGEGMATLALLIAGIVTGILRSREAVARRETVPALTDLPDLDTSERRRKQLTPDC